METRIRRMAAALSLGILGIGLAGCTGATDVSSQPTESEIQAGIERRIAAVDKDPNLSPQAKERMKAQIRGSNQAPGQRAAGR